MEKALSHRAKACTRRKRGDLGGATSLSSDLQDSSAKAKVYVVSSVRGSERAGLGDPQGPSSGLNLVEPRGALHEAFALQIRGPWWLPCCDLGESFLSLAIIIIIITIRKSDI